MADVLAHTFTSLVSQVEPGKALAVGPEVANVLVVGEQNVSHSVLLLAAVTAAVELGVRVAFFAQRPIQSLPASLQRCSPSLCTEGLKRIKFFYPRTLEELLLQVAGLHEPANTFPSPPSLVVVDGLGAFLEGPQEGSSHGVLRPVEQSCVGHLSALLCDTAAFLTRLLELQAPSVAPCRVIASYESGVDRGELAATDPTLNVLERYFRARCTLDRDRSYTAQAGGLQEAWSVYLSGINAPDAGGKHNEDGVRTTLEWQMFVSSNGSTEFKLM